MHPAELERLVDRGLGRLAEPRAPHTLLPRVMAAVRAWTERPWYERAWFTWPPGWQLASVAALLTLLAGAGVWVVPRAEATAEGLAALLTSGVASEVSPVARRAEIAVSAARIIWRTAIEPFVAYAFVFVALMCGMCAAFGTALNRVVALGRT